MTAYSVLMSVYKNDDANHLKQAVRSMADQTIPPEEIILVRDGEVGEQLQCAIDEIVSSSPGMFTYIPLEKNGGLGNALKIGIEKARNELIARMDSDDISIIDVKNNYLHFPKIRNWIWSVVRCLNFATKKQTILERDWSLKTTNR